MKREPEPYRVPLPQDKETKGKQPFSKLNFCVVCGVKGHVTRSYFTDPASQRRNVGLLCGDCFSVVSEAQTKPNEASQYEATPLHGPDR